MRVHTPEQMVKGKPSRPQDAISGPCSYQPTWKGIHAPETERTAAPVGPGEPPAEQPLVKSTGAFLFDPANP